MPWKGDSSQNVRGSNPEAGSGFFCKISVTSVLEWSSWCVILRSLTHSTEIFILRVLHCNWPDYNTSINEYFVDRIDRFFWVNIVLIRSIILWWLPIRSWRWALCLHKPNLTLSLDPEVYAVYAEPCKDHSVIIYQVMFVAYKISVQWVCVTFLH